MMTNFPYRISPSTIHGLGLFAAAPIAAGTVLWRYTEPTDYIITGMCSASPQWIEHFEKYTYRPHGKDYLVVCGDAGMFWNHSDTPNCDESGEHVTAAARDIEAGEELTVDYRQFDSRPMRWLESF